jgi:hypothetical protein
MIDFQSMRCCRPGTWWCRTDIRRGRGLWPGRLRVSDAQRGTGGAKTTALPRLLARAIMQCLADAFAVLAASLLTLHYRMQLGTHVCHTYFCTVHVAATRYRHVCRRLRMSSIRTALRVLQNRCFKCDACIYSHNMEHICNVNTPQDGACMCVRFLARFA